MCVFRHLLQILVASNSQKKKTQQPPGAAHLTLLDHLPKGEFFPMFTDPHPNTNQFLGFAVFFVPKSSQKSSPNGFWMVILHHCYKVMEKNHPTKKKTSKIQVFFLQLPSAPSHHPILPIHPFASGQNTPPAKFTTAILPCSPCRRKTASTAERDSRDPVVEGVGQAIGSKAQAPDFNLSYKVGNEILKQFPKWLGWNNPWGAID